MENHPTSPLLAVVCDDDPVVLEHLVSLIRHAGFAALSAGNSFEAITYVARHGPNVVITDLDMPEWTGEQLCWFVRQMPLAEQPLFIGISGRNKAQLPAPGTGFDACLQKPVDIDLLLGLLQAS